MAVQQKQYKQLYTADEFEQFADLPENSERLLELIHGEIVEKVPTEEHGIIALKIGARLLAYVEQCLTGRVAVEVRYRVPGDKYNARQPDVSYSSDIVAPIVKRGSVPRLPDLCVEVCSPNDSIKQLREKAEYYLQNGARLVWLVYPAKHTVEVCTLTQDNILQIVTLGIGDTLEGGAVLPGFQLAVRDIFPA